MKWELWGCLEVQEQGMSGGWNSGCKQRKLANHSRIYGLWMGTEDQSEQRLLIFYFLCPVIENVIYKNQEYLLHSVSTTLYVL